MDIEVFKGEEFSKVYQENMVPVSKKIMNLVLSYLEEKKGQPFELAVDVGCGTGRSTRPLAEHFCKVIGIDISESQINEARKCTTQENVIYHVASVEKMPLDDASVDLINAEVAAHWFPIDNFCLEVTRVLKKRGCVALHSLFPNFAIQYKNCSESLTKIYNEAVDYLCKSEDAIEILRSRCQELFEALPFADKQRLIDITGIFHFTLKDLMGFLKSTFMYHKYLAKDRAGAVAFLQTVEKRLSDTMGELSGEESLEVHAKYFCILACKS